MQCKAYLGAIAVMTVTAIAATTPAFAGSGGSLPWEGPLQQIQESITGPVAGSIALVSVATAGMMLAFGGEMNDFARAALRVTLVLGLLLGVANVVGLFGATGASIGLPGEHGTLPQANAEGSGKR
jgi:type IV secretion system protein TrbC